jgi:hypothetical protein
MAPSLADWVPEGHLARFVSDLVDEALGVERRLNPAPGLVLAPLVAGMMLVGLAGFARF